MNSWCCYSVWWTAFAVTRSDEQLVLLLGLMNSWCCFRVLWEQLLLPLPMLLAPNGLSPHSKPIVSTVRHRPGPEWGTWGNPQELNWFLLLIKPLRRTRSLRDPAQTQIWSKQVWLDTAFISQGSRSWGKLVVETWRVKTELIIITILHIIIITTSILNLSFKTIAPKILAHTKCINKYWKYTQNMCSNKIKQKSWNTGTCLKY